MPNIASAFKNEVQRIARKEVRAHAQPLQHALAAAKARIRALTERVQSLERALKVAQRSSRAVSEAHEDANDVALRFRAAGFAAHRKRLGLSASQAGRLLGVSALSVYKWESGNARPRAAHLPKIAELRKLGKREAHARLEQLS